MLRYTSIRSSRLVPAAAMDGFRALEGLRRAGPGQAEDPPRGQDPASAAEYCWELIEDDWAEDEIGRRHHRDRWTVAFVQVLTIALGFAVDWLLNTPQLLLYKLTR